MHTYKQVLLALSALQAINGADVPRFAVKKNFGSSKTIQKRSESNALLFEITNQEDFYSVDVVLGSNNESVTALLDTGSSDLWVLGKNSSGVSACDAYLQEAGFTDSQNSTVAQEIQGVESNCDSFGTFSSSKSKTFKVQKADDPFYIQYGDLTFAEGYWGSDTLTVNGVEVDSLLFAVAEISNSTNVCGIGFMQNEASDFNMTVYSNASTGNVPSVYGSDSDSAFTYKNLPYVMRDQGLIDRVSYSLFLNALGAEGGDLLFGAIDTSKYIGTLNAIPLVNTAPEYYDYPAQFDITLQGVGYVSEKGEATTLNTQYFPGLADSGTTYLNVPQDLGDLMAASVGASYDNDMGFYTLSCPSEKVLEKSAFVFQLGGENYFFPLNNFVLSTSNASTCALGITPSDSQLVILGDNILSSLYVVYDLEKYELAIARANYDGANVSDPKKVVNIPSISVNMTLATTGTGYSKTWSNTVDTITTGGDIFNGAKTVSNPWAATSTKYFAAFSTSASASSGSFTTLSGSVTGDKSSAQATGTASATKSVPSSSSSAPKSKNAAAVIGGSLITLFAALFI